MEIKKDDHLQGAQRAPIVLVEYGDYQCGYCGTAYSVVKKLQEHYGDKMLFVFRNFPLVSSHAHALDAALVAEAAAQQNQFWKMHDLLYEHQDKLDSNHLYSYAKSLNLDMKKLEKDMKKTETIERIREDMEAGEENGVDGTPSFYINGRKYHGANDYDELKEYIDGLMRNLGTSPSLS